MNLVCIGMSHTHSLQEAYLERQRKGLDTFSLRLFTFGQPPYEHGVGIEGGKVVFNRQFEEDFKAHLEETKPKAVFMYLTGAQHFLMSFINSPRPYDILMPGGNVMDLLPNAEVISYDLMLRNCEAASGMIDWLRHMSKLTDLPIYQIGLPPPVTGDEYLTSQARGDLKNQIERYGIAPESLRSKVWQICLTAVERQCAEFQIKVIRPPLEALDEKQCLLTQYRGHDAVHANAAYGDLLLDRMIGIVEQLSSGAE